MASVNKVILIGNLGRDPDCRFLSNGDAITSLSIATARRYKDANGQHQSETEWHRVIFFGKQAEAAGKYLKKGLPVYVEGRLRTRKFTDRDGIERFQTEIVGESMQFIRNADQSSNSQYGNKNTQQSDIEEPFCEHEDPEQ